MKNLSARVYAIFNKNFIGLLYVILILTLLFFVSPLSAAQKTYGTLKVTKLISVYDGDTIKVTIAGIHPLLGERISIRVFGVDTPEMRPSFAEFQKRAISARDFVRNELSGADIELRDVRRGKYFRIVANVYYRKPMTANWLYLTHELLKNGHAVIYYGGKKK